MKRNIYELNDPLLKQTPFLKLTLTVNLESLVHIKYQNETTHQFLFTVIVQTLFI